MIKNKRLIISRSKNKLHGFNYLIKKNVKLGDVFKHLPSGIIDKTQTGIGGTSCELDSDRDSIVVQPYVLTASSKAKILTIKNKFKVFFYGIKTTSVFRIRNDVEYDLLEYISFCKTKKQPIKITCVTDQLKNLENSLNKIKGNSFQLYHLVLDEIDAMQEQSNFRDVMETCFEIYKKHPKKKRTLISATIKKFHDPEIINEPYSTIKQDKATKNSLILINTTDIENELIKQVIDLAKNNPTEKIVVACNNINKSLNSIASIKRELELKNSDFKILCSRTRKNEVGEYFGEILEGGFLPAKINFITAAHFNGFDLNEKYHNIIVADSLSYTLRLSPSVIFQICGRCRLSLYSNMLLVRIVKDAKYIYYSIEELLEHANEHTSINNFLKILEDSKNSLTKESVTSMRNLYIEGNDKYPSVYSCNEDGNLKTSYFKIDNRWEQQETHKSYQSTDLLQESLQKWFDVEVVSPKHLPKSESKKFKANYLERGITLIERLSSIDKEDDFESFIRSIKMAIPKPVLPFENTICNIYRLACESEMVNFNKLGDEIKLLLDKRTFNANINQIESYFKFIRYSNKDELVHTQMKNSFPIGATYTVEELKVRSNEFASLLKRLNKTKATSERKEVAQLIKKPILIKGTLLKVEQKRNKKERKLIVTGYHPFDIYEAS